MCTTKNLATGLNDLCEENAAEFIKRRRNQIVVHSCIYYRLNTNVVSDHVWMEWANQLVEAQKRYPKISEEVELYDEFKDFDGSTGSNLASIDDAHIREIAERCVKTHKWIKESTDSYGDYAPYAF